MSPFSTPQNPLERPPPIVGRLKTSCPVWNGLGTTPVGFWLLERQIHWYGVHCTDQRPFPCLSKVGLCHKCAEGYLPRQVGYICSMRGATGGRYLLRISEYAYQRCPVLALANADLRGIPVVMRRLAERKNAPWLIEVQTIKAPASLPPPVNVVDVLSLLWGIDLRRLAADPPIDGDLSGRLRPFASQERRARR